MELIILFAFFLFFFMLLKIFRRNSSLKLPPGPRPLPIIGNLHQLGGGLMHHVITDIAKKYGPLILLKFGEVPTIVVSSPEVAKEMFKTHDVVFAHRPTDIAAFKIMTYNFSDISFSPYGNYWRQLRKICMVELLGSRRVRTFQSIREEEVFNLIKSISSHEGKIVNLSEKIFSMTYCITARAAFGKANKYQEAFKKNMEKFDELGQGLDIADLYPSIKFLQILTGMERKLKTMFKVVDEILQDIVDEHRKEMKKQKLEGEENQDIVDVFLNLQEKGDLEFPITDENIKAVLLDIFGAGGDTSAATLEWAISETIKHPRVLKRAQEEVRNLIGEKGNVDESNLDELKYLQAIIKETMRLHPGAPLSLPRESSEKCNVYGYDIPAKTRVFVNIWAIGRDPKYWSEPELFNPDRFLDSNVDYKGNDFQYIPFGAGRRICPGMSFAIPNVTLPLAQLLLHFDWKSADGKLEELDMTEGPSLTVRRKNELELIPSTYYKSCFKREL
ncbi:hypothetical protein M9H77_20133 [Catharanthus roseus]|uniref:Uncharacterized protein n=1 Tax=Catharanthus roseus TaxID=4058 RepID=A0ACC0AK99_CATRO|nr:hypothetical protein M9H77_20133 [Catharanthus roseus]